MSIIFKEKRQNLSIIFKEKRQNLIFTTYLKIKSLKMIKFNFFNKFICKNYFNLILYT